MNRSLVDRRSIVSAAALWIAGLSATGVLAQGKPEKIKVAIALGVLLAATWQAIH